MCGERTTNHVPHNRYYAFALFTTRCAHSMRTCARQISAASAAAHLIVKIDPEMSTIREPPESKVDAHGSRSVNCCSAFLRVFWLATNVNGSSSAA